MTTSKIDTPCVCGCGQMRSFRSRPFPGIVSDDTVRAGQRVVRTEMDTNGGYVAIVDRCEDNYGDGDVTWASDDMYSPRLHPLGNAFGPARVMAIRMAEQRGVAYYE